MELKTIKPPDSLKAFVTEQQLQDAICTEIKNISNVLKNRLDQPMTEYVCQIIEQHIKNGNSKSSNPIDKKQLAINICTIIFSLTPDEQITISKQIDYIISNKLIKKASVLYGIYKNTKNYLKSLVIN